MSMTGSHFATLYYDLQNNSELVVSRGQKTKELINYRMTIPPYEYMTSFKHRKFNLAYAKREWKWYLDANRFDDSIEEHATIWKKIKLDDGSFNSNYGHYLFQEDQFKWCTMCLLHDKHSRQAVIQLLNKSHQWQGNPDVVCTKSIQFLIRGDKLHMTVSMRSNDAIYGLTNDVFCFGQLHLMMWHKLKWFYKDLQLGIYTHDVTSMHVYERHFEMLEKLADDGVDGYIHIDWPKPERYEDFSMLKYDGLGNGSRYAEWILAS